MSIINNMPNKAGMTVEGLIEEYKVYAGEEITAGGFVEFVDYQTGTETITAVEGRYDAKIYSHKCLTVDANTVLFAYCDSSHNSYVCLLTVSPEKITQHTSVQLNSSTSTLENLYITKLTNGDFAVAFNQNYNTSYTNEFYVALLRVYGNVITILNSKRAAQGNIGANKMQLVTVAEGFVEIWRTNSYAYICGAMVSVVDDVMTIGTIVNIHTNSDEEDMVFAATAMLDDSVMIYTEYYVSYGGSTYNKIAKYTYSGTTLTQALLTSLNTGGYSSQCYLFPLNKTQCVLFKFASYNAYAWIFTIGTSITKGDLITILNRGYNYGIKCLSVVPLSSVKFLWLYGAQKITGDNQPGYPYYITVTFTGSSFTKTTETQFLSTEDYTGSKILGVLLNSSNDIFITHYVSGNEYVVDGGVWRYDSSTNTLSNSFTTPVYETQISNPSSADVNGIAKTSGAGGDTISVIVPNI